MHSSASWPWSGALVTGRCRRKSQRSGTVDYDAFMQQDVQAALALNQ
jgi:hypothetical protein